MRKWTASRAGALWAQTGEPSPVEAGAWKNVLPEGQDGVVLLNLENSVRLASSHSRRYQSAREELYLAALDVSEERYQFRQPAFPRQLGREPAQRPGPFLAGRDTLTVDSDLSLQRRFANGGELVAGLANRVLIDLSDSANATISSVVDVSIVQPLLRFRAREFILEESTQSERTMLANARRMKQYQQAFYISTAAGSP